MEDTTNHGGDVVVYRDREQRMAQKTPNGKSGVSGTLTETIDVNPATGGF